MAVVLKCPTNVLIEDPCHVRFVAKDVELSSCGLIYS